MLLAVRPVLSSGASKINVTVVPCTDALANVGALVSKVRVGWCPGAASCTDITRAGCQCTGCGLPGRSGVKMAVRLVPEPLCPCRGCTVMSLYKVPGCLKVKVMLALPALVCRHLGVKMAVLAGAGTVQGAQRAAGDRDVAADKVGGCFAEGEGDGGSLPAASLSVGALVSKATVMLAVVVSVYLLAPTAMLVIVGEDGGAAGAGTGQGAQRAVPGVPGLLTKSVVASLKCEGDGGVCPELVRGDLSLVIVSVGALVSKVRVVPVPGVQGLPAASL